MADAPVDKLIFQLDGDASPLKRQFQQVEQQADQTAAKVRKSMSSAFMADTTSGSSKLMQMGRDVDAYVNSLNKANDASKVVTSTTKELGAATAATHGSVATATREFRALFDELSSGRTRMVPGTLAILATRVFGVSGAVLGATAAVVGFGAAVVIAGEKSVQSFTALEQAIRSTGNSAGITVSQADAAARQIASNTSFSTLGARGAVAQGIRGGLPGGVAVSAAAISPDFGRATGQDTDKAEDALIKILADPQKGAKELVDTFHLLSASQERQIDDLDQQGRREDAQVLLIEAITQRFKGFEQQSESVFWKAWDQVGKWTGAVSDFFGSFVHTATIDQQIEAQKRAVSTAETFVARAAQPGYNGPANPTQNLADQQQKLSTLEAAKADQERTSTDQATAAASQVLIQRGIDLAKTFDLVDDKTRAFTNDADLLASALDKAKTTGASPEVIKSLTAAAAAARIASGNQRSPAEIAAQPYNDALAVQGIPAGQRGYAAQELAIRRQYEAELANPKTASSAYGIGNSRAAALHAERRNVFSDPFGDGGILGETAFGNSGLQGLATASGSGSAAEQAARRNNDARSATRALSLQASTPAEAQQVKDLTAALEKEYEVRDKLNQTIQVNDEDRSLQQQVEYAQKELSLQGESATLRAQELADLRTKQELENEGLTGKELDDEVAKRSAINQQLATTNVQLAQVQKGQQQFQQAEGQAVDAIGNSFEQAIEGGNDLRKVWQGLVDDLAKIIIKLTVIQPLEDAINAKFGTPSVGGSAGGIGGGIWNALFGGGSSSVAGMAADDSSIVAGNSAGIVPAAYASGGDPAAGVPSLVGEQGPEIFTPSGPGHVWNTDQTRRLLANAGGQTLSVTQVISLAPDATGAARAEFMRQLPFLKAQTMSGVNDALRRGQVSLPGRK